MTRKRRRRGRGHRQGQGEVPSLPAPPTARPDFTTSQQPARWWITAAVCGLPALAAAAVFANTLSNELIYDDRWTLQRIPSLSFATLFNALHSGRGLTYLLHSLDKWLWGAWMPGFHITNVILHALASALAAYAAFALTSCRRVALLCGLIFAVHPVHVEVVASFSYRKDSLAMIFVLLALVLWLGSRRPILRYAGSVFCLLLGLLSKEVAAVGLVPMLLLVDLLPGHGRPQKWQARFRRAVWRSVPFFGLGLAAGIWFVTNASVDSILPSIKHESNNRIVYYDDVLATAVGSVPDVVRLLLVPFTLSADYPIRPQTSLADPRAMSGVLLLACWIVGTLVLIRRAPVAAFSSAWILLTYVPCSNVLPLTLHFVAERYLYVPSFGVCLLVAIGIERVLIFAGRHDRARLRIGAIAIVAVIIVASGARSATRNSDWRDDLTLWSSALGAGMETQRIHAGVAKALLEQGKSDEAIQHMYRGLEIHPCDSRQNELIDVLVSVGRVFHAAEQCRERLKRLPDDPKCNSLLAEPSRRQDGEVSKRDGVR